MATTTELPRRNPAPLAAAGLYDAAPHHPRPDDPAPERVVIDAADGPVTLADGAFAQLFAHSALGGTRAGGEDTAADDDEDSVRAQGRAWPAAEAGRERPATLYLRVPDGVTGETVRAAVALVRYLDGIERDLYTALVAPWPVDALPVPLRAGVEAALRGAYGALDVPRASPAALSLRGLQAIAGPLLALARAWQLDAVEAVLAHLVVAFLADKGPSVIRQLCGAPDDLTAAQQAQLAHELAVVCGEIETA